LLLNLVKKIRIPYNTIIVSMRFVVLVGICDLTILSVLAVSRLFIDFTILLSSITEDGIGISIFGSLVFAFVFSVLSFSRDSHLTNVVEFGVIEGIPPYILLVERYATLLLCCLLCISFEICNFAVFSEYFLVIGIILFWMCSLGLIVYLLIAPIIQSAHDIKIYHTLNIAKNIFSNYITNDKKDSCAITEFVKYFRESINGIDRQLPNGVKIDDFKKNSKGSVKSAIIHYLPIYIKFGNESEIDALQKHIGEMSKSIDKNSNNITSLEIVSPIWDIYSGIENFMESHHYSIQSRRRGWIITCFTSTCVWAIPTLALAVSLMVIYLVLPTHTPTTTAPLHDVLNVAVMSVKDVCRDNLSTYELLMPILKLLPALVTFLVAIIALIKSIKKT